MLRIRNLNAASRIWRQFEEKVSNLAGGKSAEERAVYRQKTAPETALSAQQLARVVYLQKIWRKRTTHDSLITVNPKGNHSKSFNHFVNKQPVKKSLNITKQAALLSALAIGNWHDAIFLDPTVPQLALALFAAEKITRQQITTILERAQLRDEYPLVATYRLVDADGRFTREAETIFFPAIERRQITSLPPLTKERKEEFRLLILSRPASEQVFYMTECGKLQEPKKDRHKHKNLGERLLQIGTLVKKDKFLIHPSSAARDALGLCRFGADNYIPVMLRLGAQKMKDIDDGVRALVRNGIVYFPGTSHLDSIHEYPDVDDAEATWHDIYHSIIMSSIPKNLILALIKLVDITRQKTGFHWSREIWDWVDSEFVLFVIHHPEISGKNLDPLATTSLFCEMLAFKNKAGTSLYLNNRLSPLGIAMMIDMISHREEWAKLKIDANYLTDPFNFHYQNIHAIYPLLKDDDNKIQILKYIIYFELSLRDNEASFSAINKIINNNKVEILKLLDFRKLKRRTNINLKPIWENSLGLCYDGKLIDEKSLSHILKSILSHDWKEVNNQSDEGFNHYRHAVIALGYKRKDAERYAHFRKDNIPHNEAAFKSNPSITKWMKANPIKTALAFLSIIGIPVLLGYAAYRTNEEIRAREEVTKPTRSIVNPDVLKIPDVLVPARMRLQTADESKEIAQPIIEDIRTVLPDLDNREGLRRR